MTVVDPRHTVDDLIPTMRRPPRSLRLEPLMGLEWSQALEQPRTATTATRPAELRRAWVHRAPEDEVVALYRASHADGDPVQAPWWLRAVAAGALATRADGFRIEDRIAELLAVRPGWEYVPWVTDGDSGYWEYLPSELDTYGHAIPTTVVNTARHAGWIDVVPAHARRAPDPIAVHGVDDLAARLGEFETAR